jgi:hypothetical protein
MRVIDLVPGHQDSYFCGVPGNRHHRPTDVRGLADGVFIDGELANRGPPRSHAKRRKLIEKRAKRLARA